MLPKGGRTANHRCVTFWTTERQSQTIETIQDRFDVAPEHLVRWKGLLLRTFGRCTTTTTKPKASTTANHQDRKQESPKGLKVQLSPLRCKSSPGGQQPNVLEASDDKPKNHMVAEFRVDGEQAFSERWRCFLTFFSTGYPARQKRKQVKSGSPFLAGVLISVLNNMVALFRSV